jgi:hypothetical protein
VLSGRLASTETLPAVAGATADSLSEQSQGERKQLLVELEQANAAPTTSPPSMRAMAQINAG